MLLAITVGLVGAAHAWEPVRIENKTEYTVSGRVDYAGPSFICDDDDYSIPPGGVWSHSRGSCLIQAIRGTLSGVPANLQGTGKTSYGEKLNVVTYTSSGTGYAGFLVAAYGGAYRIFSTTEYSSVTDTRQGKSPGFYFVNETPWPVAFSLDQVGCLHQGIVPPGTDGRPGVIKANTGAVWFTLRMHIQADGQNPQSDFDCVEPVAELVGDVALAAVSGGSAAAAKTAGKLVIKTVVKAAIKSGLKKAGKKIATRMVKEIAKEELGRLLKGSGSIELYGQYAGYEWPFRCDDMPEYHITGGPEVLQDEEGDSYIAQSEPFTVTKVNSCGNDMMLASRRTISAGQSFFSAYDSRASTSQASSNPAAASPDSRRKAGEFVEVLRPADNRWTPATVLRLDPRNGVLIAYHDTAQQTWVPETIVRERQSINGTLPAPSTVFTHQIFFQSDLQGRYYITAGQEFVQITPQGQQVIMGRAVPSRDARFSWILQQQYGWMGVDVAGRLWSQDPRTGAWAQGGSVQSLQPQAGQTGASQGAPQSLPVTRYSYQVFFDSDPQGTYYITAQNEFVQVTPQGQKLVMGSAQASSDRRFAWVIQQQYGWTGVDGAGWLWSQNPNTGALSRGGRVQAMPMR